MKKTGLVILSQIICFSGFSENPRWNTVWETHIPAHTNLVVRWNASIGLPRKVWVYQLLPNKFSPEIVSNLMALCSFTKENIVQQNTNEVIFKSADGLRTLSISFPSGSIHYEIPEPRYSPTNLAVGVPEMSEMPKLTKKFLQKVEIKLSEIQKGTNSAPHFSFWEPFTEYYLKQGGSITNIAFRAVVFRRSVDGTEVEGKTCELHFGEHGKISMIDFSWPDLKRYKSFPALKPQAIIQLLREGKALQEPVPTNVGDIDWSNVKSVTIKKAEPCYFSGDTDWLYPFLWLDTAVDAGHGIIEVGIDCPIIDETKL